ncbi:hypothetical protein CK503_03615 [Aliifodinibius salipaludis]|uniref:Curlin n=1 Tax=Fodinibius salipaludis TaxID=2032627 RepID=A0A2A2GE80_9BACT|nr:hypothetical protein [Aliifodinibius salipaludis]PAU95294.1 hypothetical protein CK503_03615 [Aliifodinibius salipaludis]
MKKLTTLVFVLVFASSMAFAQNDATVDQNGSGNSASIDQEYQAANGVSAMNEAVVNQAGDQNDVALLDQYGAGNLYDVEQIGDGNLVKQHAEQGKHGPSTNGLIDVDQIGNNNTVHDVDQSGQSNQAYITQEGVGNFVDIEGQRSTGAAGNIIDILQTDDGDHAVGTGTGTGAYQDGVNNTMDIVQNGWGQSAGTQSVQSGGVPGQEGGQGLVQLGDGNELMIDQSGSSNIVRSVLQDGSSNMADIMQSSSGNTAAVSQVGSSNSATITQN